MVQHGGSASGGGGGDIAVVEASLEGSRGMVVTAMLVVHVEECGY